MRIDRDRDALVIVDVQNDFLPGGALGVPRGDEIIPVIEKLAPQFTHVVGTMDWHPINHSSFVAQGGPWPQHCVMNSTGAYQHPMVARVQRDVFLKGRAPGKEAYSGFDGFRWTGSGQQVADETLVEYLRERGVQQVYVVGLALDFCVKATALDARMVGFNTRVLTDATRSVFPDHDERTIGELREAGVIVTEAAFLDRLDALVEQEKGVLDRLA